MKKLFMAIAVCAVFASCTNTEDTYTSGQSEIKLAPVTSLTRANVMGSIDGVTYPTTEDFDVYAYWKNVAAGNTFTDGTIYLGEATTGVEFVNKGAYWGGATTYYWPKNGSLRFAAYSPADLDMTHAQATDTYTLSDLAYPTNIKETYDILVAPTSESYTAQTATDKVSVVFEHALSWLNFKIQSTDTADGVFTIESIVLNTIKNNGTLTANMEAGTKVWDLDAATADVTVFTGSKDATINAEIFESTTNQNGVLVLPQATTTLTINYSQKAMTGTPALPAQSVTVPLVLDGNDTPWEPGKHYIYTIIFDLDEILINPSVVDWEDIEVPVIDATAIEVATADELQSAIAAGKSVRLTADINIAEPLVVTTGDIIVELNGKTLSADAWVDNSDNSTNAYAFWVKGGTLAINGPGNVETASAEYSMAVWAQGGSVVINGGTYANAGEGSDLIYASAGGQVEIYGGTFNANEKQAGVDGTQEAYSALNLKGNGADGSTITVYGGSFYKFDPANNKSENPAVNFCAPGYTSVANGDYFEVTK